NLSDFWGRWHQTLSRFFRDYIYFPLGGSRHGKLKTMRNQIIVFLISGLWHGANMTFVLWGLYHGVLSAVEHFLRPWTKKIPILIKRGFNFLIVAFGFSIFRSPDIKTFRKLFQSLWQGEAVNFTFSYFLQKDIILIMLVGLVLSAPVVPYFLDRISTEKKKTFVPITLICLFLLSCIFMVSSSYHPFLYEQF
ncbi:MAG: MBOAT family O-acyltransferase, partial [Tissierellia bacterium]|nr:MBOAT family O-acyltransferase [Tissierellia bacterium]